MIGCNEQSNIVNPIQEGTNATGTHLSKNVHSSEPFLVSAQKGGVGRLVYEVGETQVSVIIKFKPRSVESDLWITLTMDENSLEGGIGFNDGVNLQFGPHGTQFLLPGKLDITIKKANPELLDEAMNVFYLDENGNHLDQMVYKKLVIQRDKGALKLVQAEIPHFSRYGFVR
jgi:hypothetical protein